MARGARFLSENLAIKRACKPFDFNFANVRSNADSQNNRDVLQALIMPGDSIPGISLAPRRRPCIWGLPFVNI